MESKGPTRVGFLDPGWTVFSGGTPVASKVGDPVHVVWVC